MKISHFPVATGSRSAGVILLITDKERIMRHIFLSVALAMLTAACSSTPPQEAAPVREQGLKPTAPRPVEPSRQAAIAVNPLKDPNNILSKRSIFFDFDNSLIKEEYKPLLQAHARYLAEHPGTKVTVQGNADERGSAEYNLALGQRRADAAKQTMSVLGTSGSQIDTVSFGKERPRCTRSDESCWSQNRRDNLAYPGD
jgi:peptidoglycan-associated lipoprotein